MSPAEVPDCCPSPKSDRWKQQSQSTEGLPTPPKCLFVFDFDHTLIPVDSDEHVLSEFSGPATYNDMCKRWVQRTKWTTLIAEEMNRLISIGKITDPEQVARVLQKVAMAPATIGMLRSLRDNPEAVVAILSDGNSYFIENILKHNNVRDCIDFLFSNPSRFVANTTDSAGNACSLRFDVDSQMPAGHTCERPECTPNLCKGLALHRLRAALGATASPLVYAGDGANDYCAIASPAAGVTHALVVPERKLERLVRAHGFSESWSWLGRGSTGPAVAVTLCAAREGGLAEAVRRASESVFGGGGGRGPAWPQVN